MKTAVIAILIAVVVVLTLTLASCAGGEKQEGQLTVTFIDVGKGDCVLIRKDSSAVMIDAGYSSTSGEVLSYLSKLNVSSLDYLIITHYDKDHAGGAADMIGAIDIGQVLLPGYAPQSKLENDILEALEKKNMPIGSVLKDMTFTLAGVDYTVYAPELSYDPDDGEGNDNDMSTVVAVSYGSDSYLFTGDLEKKGIKTFLESHSESYDVVKMPHHGRSNGAVDDLVKVTKPKIAVITDSVEDSAEKKTLRTLEKTGARILRSSLDGTIVISSGGSGDYTISRG